jgi:iron(III) transport system permease protein
LPPILARGRLRSFRPRFDAQTVVYLILLVVLANVVIIPVGMIVLTSLNIGPLSAADSGISIENYINAWNSSNTWNALVTTLGFALGSTVVSVMLGVLFAFLSERTDMPMRSLVHIVIPLTITLPGILYGISWVLLLSPDIGLYNKILLGLFGAEGGLLTGWAGVGLTEAPFDAYTLPAMIVVDGLRGVAVVYLMTVGVFTNMDASLEEAAQMSGASHRTVVNRITLRMLMPGILAAFLFSLTSSLETFDLPAIMGMPVGINTLSTRIYLQTTTGQTEAAATIGTMFLLIAIAAVILYSRQVRGIERFSTVTGKGYRPRPIRIGRWRWPAVGLVVFYLILVAAAPLFVVIWASILPYYQTPSLEALKLVNLDSYQFILTHPWGLEALVNTILVTLAAPTLAVLVSALVSWFVVRSKMRGKRALDVMAFLPHALPSTVVALGFVYLFLAQPWQNLPIYGTIWIIVLALSTRYLAFGSRTMHGAMIQLHKDLEEAGQTSGASFPTVFRRIVLPILFPSLVAVWVFVALISFRDATMAIMLGSPSSRVLPLFMWDAWQNGRVNDAAATGVLLMLGIIVILLVARGVERYHARRTGWK